jgi:hypothetical protein
VGGNLMPDLDPQFDEADAARRDAEEAFDRLSDHDKEALDYLATVADDEQGIDPHDDDTPHLTEEEWAYIAEATDG